MCYFCDSRMSRIASGNGNYVRLGLNGAERATIIVDIFNIIQKVRDTGIHIVRDVVPSSSVFFSIISSCF